MTARRILICMHDFSRGGTERIAIGLAASWAAAGRDVTILCGSTEGGLRDTVDPRVKVVALEPPVRRGFLSRLRLARAMGKELAGLRPDVIFLPGNFHLLLAGGLRRADPRAVIALKISNPPLPQSVPFAKAVFRHFARAVDGFAAMNGGLMRDIQALMPQKPVILLRPPFEIADPASRTISDGPSRILWVGRLEPQKDAGLALDTIKALNQILPAHLTMLGEGAMRDDIEGQDCRWD